MAVSITVRCAGKARKPGFLLTVLDVVSSFSRSSGSGYTNKYATETPPAAKDQRLRETWARNENSPENRRTVASFWASKTVSKTDKLNDRLGKAQENLFPKRCFFMQLAVRKNQMQNQGSR